LAKVRKAKQVIPALIDEIHQQWVIKFGCMALESRVRGAGVFAIKTRTLTPLQYASHPAQPPG
jgi:hypothetical protein